MPNQAEHKCGCKRLSGTRALSYYRKSFVPEGGWTNATFRTANGQAMRRDMQLVQRKATLDGIRLLTRYLQPKFNGLIDRIIREVYESKARLGQRIKSAGDIPDEEFVVNPNGDQLLWGLAIERVMEEFDEEIIVQATPLIQSTAATVHGRTNTILGVEEHIRSSARILEVSRPLAENIVNINDTTRRQLSDVVVDGFERSLPVNEVARNMRDTMGSRFAQRIPTIARTEMGRAADAGRVLSIQDSGIVLTVEVIGCQAVEPGIPTYRGRPTCNITEVPAGEAHMLSFHPNHTGTIVPETFSV